MSDQLLKNCTEGGHEAWNIFVERFHPFISRIVRQTLRRCGASFNLAEDLVQDVYLKLYEHRLRLLGQFESIGDGRLYGYLKVITSNLVRDYLRVRHARKRGAGAAAETLQEETLASGTTSEQFYLSIFLSQSDTALVTAGFSNEERVLFWLYYREGMTAMDLSGMPRTKLTVKGVESKLRRMTIAVREHATGHRASSGIPSRRG